MARGRMLNNRISRNNTMAMIDKAAGPYGVIAFTWLISHLDREGRFHGDPAIIKGAVCPLLQGCTIEVIEAMLDEASKLGLIDLYEADGVLCLSFPKFAENQIGLRKKREPKSDLPGPEDGVRKIAGNHPEDCRQTSGRLPENFRKIAG